MSSDYDIIDAPDYDVVYIPSQTIDPEEIAKLLGFVYYEERPLFCSILRLKLYPNARCVYVTSTKIEESIVDYYINLTISDNNTTEKSIRERLLLLTVNDPSAYPLTQKIIDNKDILNQIKNWINTNKSYMRCVISTPIEEKLAKLLNIPLRANPAELAPLGTKHGSRKIFQEANIPIPDGTLEVFTINDYINSIIDLWNRNPNHCKYVAKLNDGVSGDGNAILYLNNDKISLEQDDKYKYILNQLNNMNFVADSETWDSFSNKLQIRGGIVEVWVDGNGSTSPSAQGIITIDNNITILSTHEQILAKNNSLYTGCHFPAICNYRSILSQYCYHIGKILAKYGAKERYAVDYVCIPKQDNQYDIYAIEINLRSGGTTHPCETARLLCGGYYCKDNEIIISSEGDKKYYRGSDNLVNPNFKHFSFQEFTQILQNSKYKWDYTSKTGCIFYFLGALPTCGKVGMLAIGNSKEQSVQLFDNAVLYLSEKVELLSNNDE